MPARRRLEKLAAGLLQSRQSRPVRVAGRSVHGSAAGRARRTRQPVDGRALGAAATAGQRRQVRARPRHRHSDEENAVDGAATSADVHRRARDRGRRRLRRRHRPRILGV